MSSGSENFASELQSAIQLPEGVMQIIIALNNMVDLNLSDVYKLKCAQQFLTLTIFLWRLVMSEKQECESCGGTGKCPVCNDTGTMDDGFGTCVTCHGAMCCPYCNGTGEK
jgi:hypothetical protein